MRTIILDEDCVCIPAWVHDHESFRRWARSEEFPETGRVCYLDGNIWVDMSKEQVFTHNQVKREYTVVLGGLAKAGQLGRFFPDGVLVSNEEANLTSQPDGSFASWECLQPGRLRLVGGAREGHVELEGTPDMALEIVSPSSVNKDTDTLFELYWRSGILEYWLVDVRGERLRFDIYRHTAKGYIAAPKRGGWMKSNVFGKSFRLTRQTDRMGHPEYTLEVR